MTTPPPTPTPIPTVVPVAPVQAAAPTTIVLDSFDSVSQWTTTPADGVEISVHPESSGLHGRSMRVDFDFHGHGGYAVIHRPLLLVLPPNYEFSFRDPRGRADQHARVQADRLHRRKRLVVEQPELSVPEGLADGHAKEAADHLRVGTDRRQGAEALCGDRDRDHRRLGWEGQHLARRSGGHAARARHAILSLSACHRLVPVVRDTTLHARPTRTKRRPGGARRFG